MCFNRRAAWRKAKPLIYRHSIQAGVDREVPGVASFERRLSNREPKTSAKPSSLKRGCDKQVVQVAVVPHCNDPSKLVLDFSYEVREVAGRNVASNGLLTYGGKERFSAFAVW